MLLEFFYQAPQYLRTIDAVKLVTKGWKRFAEIAGQLLEVVVAGTNDISRIIVPGEPGVYAVNTGSTGVAQHSLRKKLYLKFNQ